MDRHRSLGPRQGDLRRPRHRLYPVLAVLFGNVGESYGADAGLCFGPGRIGEGGEPERRSGEAEKRRSVGWVERSETHHRRCRGAHGGLRFANPPYGFGAREEQMAGETVRLAEYA